MKKKLIKDAIASELRDFASVMQGIETDGSENSNTMKGRLTQAGWNNDYIIVAEEAAAPAETTRPTSYRKTKNAAGQTVKEVCINLQARDGPGGSRPVPVSVNGSVMLIPRGKAVWVPEHYEEALRHAVQRTYEASDDGLANSSEVTAYPYSVVTPPHAEMANA